jgi:hypothetical protein
MASDRHYWEETLHKEFLCRVFTMHCFRHIRWRASEIWAAHTRKSGTWQNKLDYVAERHGAFCDVCGVLNFDYGVWPDLPPFKGKFLCWQCLNRYRGFCHEHGVASTEEQSGILWLSYNLAKGKKWVTHKPPSFGASNSFIRFDDMLDRIVRRTPKQWKDGMPIGIFVCHVCCTATHDASKLCNCDDYTFVRWMPRGELKRTPSQEQQWRRTGVASRSRHRFRYELIRLPYGASRRIKANIDWWEKLRFTDNWPALIASKKMKPISDFLYITWAVREWQSRGWKARSATLAGWCRHYLGNHRCHMKKPFPDRARCGPKPRLKCNCYARAI